MARIIMLQGDKNVGKTTTIRLVYDSLLMKDAKIITPRQQEGAVKRDFSAILLYGTKLIIFHSTGDAPSQVEKHIINIDKEVAAITNVVCQDVVLITACRKSRTYNKIIRASGAVVVQKTNADDMENVKVAKKVLQLI